MAECSNSGSCGKSSCEGCASKEKSNPQNFMAEQNANILVRGLRAVSDYEYELQFTLTNTILAKQPFETLFFTAPREYLYLSSSLVKEVALNNGKLDRFLPENIIKDILEGIDRSKDDYLIIEDRKEERESGE